MIDHRKNLYKTQVLLFIKVYRLQICALNLLIKQTPFIILKMGLAFQKICSAYKLLDFQAMMAGEIAYVFGRDIG